MGRPRLRDGQDSGGGECHVLGVPEPWGRRGGKAEGASEEWEDGWVRKHWAAGAEAGRWTRMAWANVGMEISTPSCPPGPHHEGAADFGELPVGTCLAEGTHPVLLFAPADLLPMGKEGAASSLSGLGLPHCSRWTIPWQTAPHAAVEPRQPASASTSGCRHPPPSSPPPQEVGTLTKVHH